MFRVCFRKSLKIQLLTSQTFLKSATSYHDHQRIRKSMVEQIGQLLPKRENIKDEVNKNEIWLSATQSWWQWQATTKDQEARVVDTKETFSL